MIRLDVARFQPGYQKPQPPKYADEAALRRANLIVDRVESAVDRIQESGEGEVHGDQVMLSLESLPLEGGNSLQGWALANAESGELSTLRAKVTNQGEDRLLLSYSKTLEGREYFEDSSHGSVVRSREEALLQDPNGALIAKLY